MRYETKGGLFKPKPIPISKVYKKSLSNERSFSVLITNFTTEKIVRDLLFKFINSISFTMSLKVFEKQLKLLEPLTIDEQIKLLSKTIEKGWGSLFFEYNNMMNKLNRRNYENK